MIETKAEEPIKKAIISVSKNVKPSTPEKKIQPRDFLFSESFVTIILHPLSVSGTTSNISSFYLIKANIVRITS